MAALEINTGFEFFFYRCRITSFALQNGVESEWHEHFSLL